MTTNFPTGIPPVFSPEKDALIRNSGNGRCRQLADWAATDLTVPARVEEVMTVLLQIIEQEGNPQDVALVLSVWLDPEVSLEEFLANVDPEDMLGPDWLPIIMDAFYWLTRPMIYWC